jgi:uncharacterized protein DUF6659
MDYSKLCKDIFNLDKKIRFAAICDRTGESRYGGLREGIKSLLSPEQTKESVLQAWNRWELRNAIETRTGKGLYAMAAYEKVKRITIPVDNEHLLLLSTEPEADHVSIIDNILKSIHG